MNAIVIRIAPSKLQDVYRWSCPWCGATNATVGLRAALRQAREHGMKCMDQRRCTCSTCVSNNKLEVEMMSNKKDGNIIVVYR